MKRVERALNPYLAVEEYMGLYRESKTDIEK